MSLDNLGNLDKQTKRIGCLPFMSIPDDFDDLAKDEIVELFTKTDDDLL